MPFFDIYIYNRFTDQAVFFQTVEGRTPAMNLINKLRRCGNDGYVKHGHLHSSFFHNEEFAPL